MIISAAKICYLSDNFYEMPSHLIAYQTRKDSFRLIQHFTYFSYLNLASECYYWVVDYSIGKYYL